MTPSPVPRARPLPRPRRSLAQIYLAHLASPRRERLFLASTAFAVTEIGVRLITLGIRLGVGPFQNINTADGTHLHHLVWGIALLLFVGYLWLADWGTDQTTGSRWPARITAMLYGAGASLTLDEFALWLNLKDVYWEAQGKESVQAVFFFFSLLSVGIWGGPFFGSVWREIVHVVRLYLLVSRDSVDLPYD